MSMFSPNSAGGSSQQFGSYQRNQSGYNPYQQGQQGQQSSNPYQNPQFNQQQQPQYGQYQPQQYGQYQPQQQYGNPYQQQQYNPYQQQQQYGNPYQQQQYNPYQQQQYSPYQQQQQYNPYQQQQQYGNPFQQQQFNPYPQQQQQFNSYPQQQQPYNPYQNPQFQQPQPLNEPKPPAYTQSPEFQGYQTQMQGLNDQLNAYTKQSPLYQQIQDLQGKMRGYQESNSPNVAAASPQNTSDLGAAAANAQARMGGNIGPEAQSIDLQRMRDMMRSLDMKSYANTFPGPSAQVSMAMPYTTGAGMGGLGNAMTQSQARSMINNGQFAGQQIPAEMVRASGLGI